METSITHQEKSPLVHLISLGCSRNRVDSEVMLGSMLREGWKVTDTPAQANAIVVNTCGFIASAKEESIDTILEAAALKKDNPDLKVVVTGCLTQRYKTQLAQGLPEVDFFVGTDEFSKIADFLKTPPPRGTVHAKRTHYLYNEDIPRVNTLAKYSAYVKVAEGCQHNCSFCIIPAIRGKLRSRPLGGVIREVHKLAEEGVLEVNLIAQDLAAYGRDFRPSEGTDFLRLLRELVKVDGLQWIRPLYVYPENISDDFLEFFAQENKIVKYMDIPSQHASDNILKRMNRGIDRQGLRAIFKKLRTQIPDIAIRTSVMVGFPGETDDDFEQLLDFLAEERFRHLGCFSYSQEEGTVAGRMADQIPEEVKAERLARVMTLQKEISKENLSSFHGKILPVLVEGPSEESDLLWQGRLSTQAPEVDGVVYINDGPVKAGTIQMVHITETHDYDLVGEVVGTIQ